MKFTSGIFLTSLLCISPTWAGSHSTTSDPQATERNASFVPGFNTAVEMPQGELASVLPKNRLRELQLEAIKLTEEELATSDCVRRVCKRLREINQEVAGILVRPTVNGGTQVEFRALQLADGQPTLSVSLPSQGTRVIPYEQLPESFPLRTTAIEARGQVRTEVYVEPKIRVTEPDLRKKEYVSAGRH